MPPDPLVSGDALRTPPYFPPYFIIMYDALHVSGGAISFFSLGVLLCDTSVVKSMHFPLQYGRDIRTHQGANAVLIVYATTNVLVAINENQGPNITLATKYVALNMLLFLWPLRSCVVVILYTS